VRRCRANDEAWKKALEEGREKERVASECERKWKRCVAFA
jgi:hypothetical protein